MVPVDALTRLIDAIQAAGGRFTRRGDVLWVHWGTLGRDEQDALTRLIKPWQHELLALVDAEVVFPGLSVVPCPTCGGTQWRKAGDREVCVVCHPAPGSTA
jgi:hypothetical protein